MSIPDKYQPEDLMKHKHVATFLITTPILVGAILALCLPLQIASHSASSQLIAMAQFIFPTVDKMKGGYPLDQIALVYFSTVWLMTPIAAYGWYLYIEDQKEKVLRSCKANRWVTAFYSCVFFPTIVVISIFANFESTDTTEIRNFLIYQTRLGMAVMRFWIPIGASMFLAICAFWWSHIEQVFKDQAGEKS